MLLEQQKMVWSISKVKPSEAMAAAQTVPGHHVW